MQKLMSANQYIMDTGNYSIKTMLYWL